MLQETRVFAPPRAEDVGGPGWLIGTMEQYRAMHARSIGDPDGFWGEAASELHWFRKWDRVVEWNPPDAQWFVGGKTNLCYNAVDRHVLSGHGSQTAIVWEGEPMLPVGGKGAGRGAAGATSPAPADTGDVLPDGRPREPEVKRISYGELRERVCRCANVLKGMGVKKGDVVTIYMGMVPELAVAVLACARIGAVHSVIFGGFSSQAIVDRVFDARSRVIVTCDGAWRRGKVVPLKENVDAACNTLASQGHKVDHVLVVNRCDNHVVWQEGRDQDWERAMAGAATACPCEPMDAEDTAFMLYTSGSTGKPKGIVHSVGGFMVFTYLTSKYVFNLVPGSGQLYWCTADVGWITGHSYILYGILPNRVPTLMYEGAPNAPSEDRFWSIIARHKVTHFYTAPTAIRAFMKWGTQHPAGHDLSSLQVLGSVGEPINPEAWMWYRANIGRGVCPIVDTWWQTETGGHMITPLPGVTPTKPGSCTLPFFGVDAAIMDEAGVERAANAGGLLGLRRPWPSMLRGVYGDRQRFVDTYFSKFKVKGWKGATSPYYFTGDGARRDEDGYFWIMGRVDDVINVSGHRLGTMEVESALVSHPAVVEAAVVGMPHEIKGTGVAAFCTLGPSFEPGSKTAADELKRMLGEHVTKEIGAIARPDQIRFTPALPKTRSGKIMRRLLRAIAAGEEKITQDTTTLEDYSVLARLKESEEG